MALVKCKECEAQISTKAESCPHCGAKRKKGIGCGGLVLACFLFFIIISVISASFRSSSSDSPAPTEAPPPAPPKPSAPKTQVIVTPQSVAVPPAPVVTPKPKFDILTVPPSEIPQTTRVTKDVDFALPGESGSVTAPAGAEVTILSRKGDQLNIAFASFKKTIPYSITTIEEDVTRNRELAEKALLELHAQKEMPKNAPAPEEKADPEIIKAAYYKGRRFINDSLKAPSTAKFSNILHDDKTGAVKLNSGRYKGWGTVEAQNSFGVPLKEDWVTELQPEGDSWRIVYARLGAKVLVDSRETRKTEKLKGAERFIGMSKSGMMQELGQPISTRTGENSSDGKYTMYIYSEEKGKETFFSIWDSDGVIDSGMYQGTDFGK